MKLTKDQKAIYEYEGVTFFSPLEGSKATKKLIDGLRDRYHASTILIRIGNTNFAVVANQYELVAVNDLEKYAANLENEKQLSYLKENVENVIKKIGTDRSFNGSAMILT